MALINKIIPFSCVDGPGNRMVIFFQGCNFKCFYCHNPETINKCISCGKCVENCEVGALSISDGKVIWDKEECISCDKCIKLCEHMSSPKLKEYSVEELVKKIEKDSFFIRGITVSGGECTLNSEFLIKLFREVKKLGLTCFADTSGNTKLDDELITRKFLNFNLESISIEQATESDFSNSLSKDNKNEEPLDYFDIVFSIRAKNTSKNLCTDNIVPHIILTKELKSNGYIDIGLNPLSSTDEIILPGHEKGFPYKLFVKKGKYSKEELLKLLKECKFKVNIVSFKKTKMQFLTYGGSVEYIE